MMQKEKLLPSPALCTRGGCRQAVGSGTIVAVGVVTAIFTRCHLRSIVFVNRFPPFHFSSFACRLVRGGIPVFTGVAVLLLSTREQSLSAVASGSRGAFFSSCESGGGGVRGAGGFVARPLGRWFLL
jgi:hypothetical protein